MRKEEDTRAELIDPALVLRGWGGLIRREVTLGRVVLSDGERQAKRDAGRVDYTLRITTKRGQAIAVAVVEAKPESSHPGHGLEQAKRYAVRLNTPFVYSSNGHQFVEYDTFTHLTTDPKPMSDFPTPAELYARWEAGQNVDLDSEAAKPLTTPYAHGESQRRGYQDAAIRAVLTALARGQKRALLHLATGTGKTFIAANLLKKISQGEQLGRALFLCDRDELRTQALGAMQAYFGGEAAAASASDPAKNARVIVATYQTLGFDNPETETSSYLSKHYPPNFFTHIIVDEAHRSGFRKWRQVLDQNADAVQIGLTATPRTLVNFDKISSDDQRLLQDTEHYFGEAVYSYSLPDALEDGYLATPVIDRMRVKINKNEDGEDVTGITSADLAEAEITDVRTGTAVKETRAIYQAHQLERDLELPERVSAMCADLFGRFLRDEGTPETKTIVFCASDPHSQRVTAVMNDLYAQWCQKHGRKVKDPYAVQVTSSTGAYGLADFKGAAGHTFIAATVDLLSTGVDVPALKNVVFFRYIKSAISVSQMVGRGTRLDPATGKLFFRIYDYTDATRLLGEEFESSAAKPSQPSKEPPKPPGEGPIIVRGVLVEVSDAGRFIVGDDGRRVALGEALEDLKRALRREASSLEELRQRWVPPRERKDLVRALGSAYTVAPTLRHLKDMDAFDLWDFLGETGYDMDALTRDLRAGKLLGSAWAAALEERPKAVAGALMGVFRQAGTEGLEGREVFTVPAVAAAGGLAGLGGPDRFIEMRGELFA